MSDSNGSDICTPTGAMRRHFSTLKIQDVWCVSEVAEEVLQEGPADRISIHANTFFMSSLLPELTHRLTSYNIFFFYC